MEPMVLAALRTRRCVPPARASSRHATTHLRAQRQSAAGSEVCHTPHPHTQSRALRAAATDAAADAQPLLPLRDDCTPPLPRRLFVASERRPRAPPALVCCALLAGALGLLAWLSGGGGGGAMEAGSWSHAHQAFAMSLGAGLSTGIGALFVCASTSLNRPLLAATMAFSAGVMTYVSLVEVISVAEEYLAEAFPPTTAYALATLAFFAGVVAMAVLDAAVYRIFDAAAESRDAADAECGEELCGEALASGGADRSVEMYVVCIPVPVPVHTHTHRPTRAAAAAAAAARTRTARRTPPRSSPSLRSGSGGGCS